jgi:hypothetical protein
MISKYLKPLSVAGSILVFCGDARNESGREPLTDLRTMGLRLGA